jgi:Aminoglycoside-2''-adenylyltransferase
MRWRSRCRLLHRFERGSELDYRGAVSQPREDGGDFAHLWAWEPVTPRDVSELLSGFGNPWWICGGWALDLFEGQETRRHDDIDVAVLRRDQRALHSHFDGWDLRYATPEHTLEPWDGRWLDLPIHGVWARRSADPVSPWTCEFLLNEAQDDEWVFRRNDAVRRGLDRISSSTDGIPYLCPEIVLLYKAAERSPKNEADFALARPRLSDAAASWLASALETCHPQHPWLSHLPWG